MRLFVHVTPYTAGNQIGASIAHIRRAVFRGVVAATRMPCEHAIQGYQGETDVGKDQTFTAETSVKTRRALCVVVHLCHLISSS